MSYSGGFLGVGVVVAIGVGMLLVGVVVLVIANGVYPQFFRRKLEKAPPEFLERPPGDAAVDTVTPDD